MKLIAGLVIAVAVVLAVTSVWNDSFIVDEIPHVGAGYSYLTKQDMRINPEHPPLAKDLAAIPLLRLDVGESVFETKYWKDDVNGQWDFGKHLIYNSANVDAVTRWAKMPMLLFFILSAALVFKWARELYGKWAAFIALILFSFSPLIMAHSRFVTTDVAALWGVLWATYFLVRYFKTPTKKNLLLASIIAGLALSTKFSVFLIVPFFLVIAAVWEYAHGKFFRYIPRAVLVLAAGFILIIWPLYYFHTYSYPPERQHRDTEFLLSTYGTRPIADSVVWASDKPVLRAAGQYALGLLMVNQRSAGGNTRYFLGEVSAQGSPIYFPVVYFLKEPLAWWGLVILSLGIALYHFKKTKLREALRNNFTEIVMILWLALYWFISIRSNLNIGARHLLPIYPFAIILVSGGIALGLKLCTPKFKKALAVSVIALLSWYVFENLNVYPYYLTYFNQVAGGSEGGHKFVVDSNLDWGQDLKRLTQWVEENNIQNIYLDYFGWADPNYYLKGKQLELHAGDYDSVDEFLAKNPEGGFMAISGSFYMTSRENPASSYEWLDPIKPVIVIGNSIFVWHLTK